MSPASPRPLRGLLRFSLRGLIVLVSLVCLGLGWWSDRAGRQRRAIAAVERAGGYVSFAQGHTSVDPPADRRPAWAPRWLPEAYFERPRGVWFAGATARGFSFLRDLPTLESASFVSCPGVSDADLAALATLRRLELVCLIRTPVTNEGLAHLARLPRLKILQLRGTEIDDRALPHLERLGALEELDVFDTQISRAGVAALVRALPGCQLYQRP